MKEILKKILLICFSLLFALIISEYALRVLYPEERKGDDLLGNIGQPGGEIDARGFRNDSVLESVDIVAIGDSQTFGNNAKTSAEAWPQVLSDLRAESVYQMAFGGYGPIQYAYLFDRAEDLNPQKIIIGLYLGNDLSDAYRQACLNEKWQKYCREEMRGKKIDSNSAEIRLKLQYGFESGSWRMKVIKARRWVRKNSRVYALLGNSSRGIREKLGLAESSRQARQRIEDWAKESPDAIIYKYGEAKVLLSPSYRLSAIDLDRKETKEGLRISKEIFSLLQKKSNQSGRELLILIIPTKEMVFYQYAKENTGTDLIALDNYISKEKQAINELSDFFEQNNMDYLFLGQALSAGVSEGKKVYGQSMDGHPLSDGYRLMAEAVNDYLNNKATRTQASVLADE